MMATRTSASRQSSSSENVCNLCYQETGAWAVGQCDHSLCLPCSARLRVLCNQKECPVCRINNPKVVVLSKPRLFSSVAVQSFIEYYKKQYGFFFETPSLLDQFKMLLSHYCTKCRKKQSFPMWAGLKEHMRNEHNLTYCNICLNNLKLFPCEQKTYSRQELSRHEREGDLDDKSRKGHPLCEFCTVRFLDNDALFEHLKKSHFSCHFCDADGKQDYYPDYSHLKVHFRKAHYLCEQGECYHEKFTSVFRTKIDLQAHRSKVHKKGLSKAEAKQLCQIDVGFTYARGETRRDCPPSQRRHHQYPHNRQSEMEQLEVAKAMSLAEHPYNRGSQRKEGSDQGRTPVVMENEVTTEGEESSRKGKSSNSSTANKKVASRKKPPPGLTPVDTHNITSAVNVEPSTAIEQTPSIINGGKKSNKSLELPVKTPHPPPGMDSQAGHSDSRTPEVNVFIIAQELLKHDTEKVEEFRTKCGMYLRSTITVTDYYSACSELFGSCWNDFGLKLAETIPDDVKCSELKDFLLRKSEVTVKRKKPPPGFNVPVTNKSKKKTTAANHQSSGPWQSSNDSSQITNGLSSADFPSLTLNTAPVTSGSKTVIPAREWDISEADFPCLGSGPVLSRSVVPSGWNVKVSVK